MPHRIFIDADVVWSTYWGEVTIEELRAAKREMTELRGFRRELSHIIDVSDVAIASLSAEALQEFEKERSVVSPLALQILVVHPQAKLLHLARSLQSLGESSGRSILIVYSQEEARAMLRLLRPGSAPPGGKSPEPGSLSLDHKRRA